MRTPGEGSRGRSTSKQWQQDHWAVYEKAPFMAWNNAWFNAPCAFWPTKSLKPVNVANAKLPPVLLFQAESSATVSGGATLHGVLGFRG